MSDENEVKTIQDYDESTIRTLDPLEHVRSRPGMYIGRLGDGSHRDDGIYVLLKEVIDNSIDESLAGYCNSIKVKILPGNIIEIEDNGRGIPVGINKKHGVPAVTLVFTVLHAGARDEAEKLANAIKAVCENARLSISELTPSLSVHVGRGMMAVCTRRFS